MSRYSVGAAAVLLLFATAASGAGLPAVVVAQSEGSLSGMIVDAANRSRIAAVAQGATPDEGQAAVEQAVQAAIAESGETPEAAARAITTARNVLQCPPIEQAEELAVETCPAWVNAALVAVYGQIMDASASGPAAGGPNSGRVVSIPPPPVVSSTGSAGYRNQ